ncbi:MAG: HDOD domain-containing protein [Spirochaetes bacterium]|nr:HDOD domain-containing protein [Spirochaetota bacterium]
MNNTSQKITELEKNGQINIQFYYHSEVLLRSIDALFSKLLAKIDLIYLLDSMVTILREIIANAIKANAKRYYFKKNNLDIDNDEAYIEGMKDFKMRVIGSDSIEKELEKTDYKVTLKIKLEENDFIVIVENNSVLHPKELERINLRINKARGYKDFTDAYDDIYDETEGAGLGIVLTILLLKNTGIGNHNFSITGDNQVTQSKIIIPYEIRPVEITTQIKQQITKEIDGLPTFDSNILELLNLCKDPETPINIIVGKIMNDPALAADILKLSNSAGFFTSKRVTNISEAIIIIGLSNLRDLLIITSTRRILENRYSKFSEIWKHCIKTAGYAREISLKFCKPKNVDMAFLGGLLHDIGKIVLLTTDTKFTSWISGLTKDRKIKTSTVLEEVTLGISHSSIGELMANKWNFPDYLIDTIKYHHSPLSADEIHSEIVFSVYLANILCGMETGKYHYSYIEETVLEKFQLSSEKIIDDLHKELMEKETV